MYLSPSASITANQAAGAFGPELLSITIGLVLVALLLPGGGKASGRSLRSPRLGIGPTGAARATAVVVLLIGLTATKPALAWCADSSCCFVSNNQAILAVAAILLLLTLPFIGEAILGLAVAIAELGELSTFAFLPEAVDFAGEGTSLIEEIEASESISTAKAGQAVAPRDLNEQTLWGQLESDPGGGDEIFLNDDPRFANQNGWQKMQISRDLPDGKSITIHYQYNNITGRIADPKIVTPQRIPPVLQPGPSIEE